MGEQNISEIKIAIGMHGFRTFGQRGSNSTLTMIFFLDEGREDPYTTKSGPSSACKRNDIKMVYHWRADDGPTFNVGLVAL